MTATREEELVTDYDLSVLGGEPIGSAVLNKARTHRYLLTRWWSDDPLMTWLMLNPSTANAFRNDPTIGRCAGFAKREGCGGIKVINLYGLRSRTPYSLWEHPDPVGPSNDRLIDEHTRDGGLIIAGWGALGEIRLDEGSPGRGVQVGRRLTDTGVRLLCVGLTAKGHPRHPLYARSDAPLTPWQVPA